MGILNGTIPLQQLRFKDDNLPTDTSIEQVLYNFFQNVQKHKLKSNVYI